ncbi:hypothetical protein H0H81_007490 [Sphagnurus paluster]|uniref:Sphingolipid long chain base-responsive protein LSP1 n=1 Tax=Sphagnurus paluster TaxID=117069 RepID=A0A9P7KP22_9AGAR|nr:hypothetical protein H0H81_007490 [Sphagnurus paluster]
MPVPSFLASFADKAQSAINASPLGAHLPNRPTSPDTTSQPSANEAAAQGSPKSHTLGAIQNQIRAFGQQYASTTPVQKIITIEKSVSIDFETLSRNAKSQSKEIYTWGQSEPEDLRDVTDRLAYLNFVQGSLSSSLAAKLDAARAPFKALRDAETAITPRRNLRLGLQNQLARIEHDHPKGAEKKIGELKDQIRKAELDDESQEKEIELLKRKAVRESEQLKWDAFREYGEKLVLLSQASAPIIAALPTIPPSPDHPYTGLQATGAARASLQRALDNYKTGHINLPPQPTGADLHRSDTRSFGESHASELSSIDSSVATHDSGTLPVGDGAPSDYKIHSPPPAPFKPSEAQLPGAARTTSPPPIDPTTLNQSPTPIPISSPIDATQSPVPILSSTSPIPVAVTPVIAETGIPVVAGSEGPGPARGSLHDIRAAPAADDVPAYGQLPASGDESSGQNFASAGEEKARLQALYSQPPAAAPEVKPASGSSAPQFESAEDEKKRLEREERERILNSNSGTGDAGKKDNNDDLPPTYQDF